MYWNSILWFISWPLVVIVSYQLIKCAVKKYKLILDKPLEKAGEK